MHPGVVCLFIGFFLFLAGLIQALSSRQFLGYLFGIELILNAANVNVLGFIQIRSNQQEFESLILFIVAYAAIETAVGLAIFSWATSQGRRLQSPFAGL